MMPESPKQEPIKQILAFNIYKEICKKYYNRQDLLIKHYRNDRNEWQAGSTNSGLIGFRFNNYSEPAIVISNKTKDKRTRGYIIRIIVTDINISICDKYNTEHEYDIADPNDFDFDKFMAFINSLINCTKLVVSGGVRIQGLDKLIC